MMRALGDVGVQLCTLVFRICDFCFLKKIAKYDPSFHPHTAVNKNTQEPHIRKELSSEY